MHGVFASPRASLLYLLAWAMLGLMLAALLAAGGASWSASLAFAVPLSLMYAFATGFSAYYVCRAYPLGQRSAAAIVIGVGAAAAGAAGLWSALGAAWSSLVRALAPQSGAIDMGPALGASMFGLGVLLYGLAAAVNYLLIEGERVRQLEMQGLRMTLAARDAELRMLRAQVDPHFLFNSLNSVSALVTVDPAGARAMVVALAEFFRHSLGLQADRKVTLDAELRLVEHFVAIESVRFGARLAFEADVDDAARVCLLPPMLLQPLVENAVKHGVAQMLDGGRVRLAAVRAGTVLQVCVENDVDPDGTPASFRPRGSGMGLANVRQRLAAAYGDDASVHWRRDGARNVFRVDLQLPLETKED